MDRQNVIKEIEVATHKPFQNSGEVAYELFYTVKEEDVSPRLKADSGITPQELIGTGLTTRIVFPNTVNGRVRVNLNWPFITANTVVFASATEVGPDGTAFIGNANYTVSNVVPFNGGVVIIVNIGWNSPLPLRVDYLAIQP